jgi:preprotein translocase subunit SecG
MSRNAWIVLGVVAIGIILCGCLVLALLIPGWFSTNGGFYGPGMGHMFGDCPWCGGGGGFGAIGVAELLIILIIFAVLLVVVAAVVLGVIWLIRSQAPSREEEVTEERVTEEE